MVEQQSHTLLNNITLVSHIYNEEYLLPFWLQHHKTIFKDAIIIDYNSTDRSCDIIREYCPNWKIIKSQNTTFDAHAADNEVMRIESSVECYKIVLNITEFFLISNHVIVEDGLNCFNIPMLNAASSKEDFFPKTLKDFFSGIEKISYKTSNIYRGASRFLHNYKTGEYTTGRHHTNLNISKHEIPALIIWVGMYPWNTRTIQRKMQIKHKISEHDKKHGLGNQHFLTESQLHIIKNEMFNSGEYINNLENTFKRLILDIQQ